MTGAKTVVVDTQCELPRVGVATCGAVGSKRGDLKLSLVAIEGDIIASCELGTTVMLCASVDKYVITFDAVGGIDEGLTLTCVAVLTDDSTLVCVVG